LRVIDLTAQSALHVRFDPSPVYDFLAALYLVRHWTPERGFDVDPAWVRAARRALGPRLMADAGLLLPPRSPVLGVLAVLEETPGLSVRAALRRLRQLSPPSLVERMLGGPTAVRPLLLPLRQAIQGDRAALEAVVAAFPREYDPHAVRRLLAAGPAAVHARLLRLLRAFYTRVYAREEARVAPLLAADVAARQALAGVLAPADLVERVTGGFVIAPGTGIAQVLLAPTYFFRPYNLLTEYHGVRLFIYPIELPDGREREARPPQELVRLYKALADETRLRILRLLSQREMYVQEIANALGVSHVTALHHLAQLRAAYLVQAVERDNLRYYRLRPEAVREAERRWWDFLHAEAVR